MSSQERGGLNGKEGKEIGRRKEEEERFQERNAIK
jgi:hypothetical protein